MWDKEYFVILKKILQGRNHFPAGRMGKRMKLYHEIQYRVLPEAADFNGKWKPGDVFRSMQRVAELHAELLGWGYHELLKKNIAWVLTRSELQMEEYPEVWEEITIATWTGLVKHSVFPRYFEFRATDGRVLGKAVTLWVLLDMKERCMVAAEKAEIQVPADVSHEPALPFPTAPRELRDVEPVLAGKLPVYSDLDIIGHVNNTRYIDWLCDLFEPERYKEKQISHIKINYAGEILPGTELTLMLAEAGDEFSLRDCPGGKAHFTIQGKWK